MKLTIALTIFCLMQVSATVYTQTNQFTLDVKNKQILDVLKEIETQSDYRFFYQDEQIDVNRKISIDIKSKKFGQVIHELFSDQDISYKIFDNGVVLLTKKNIKYLNNQEFTIKGKVTDISGSPLPGVNVIEKGTTNGAITNLEGEYIISISSLNAVLSFSYIGYLTENVEVNGNPIIDLVLIEDIQQLEEVVVTAMGISRERKQLSYATQQIDSEQIGGTGNNNAIKGLQGKVAGVTVRQQSGKPGASLKVTIRGSNSINGDNSPLYVVDGFPLEGSVSLDIDPSEIESMSVLKGASAAALYGLRASNGVILITTKRGKGLAKNKPQVTFNNIFSFDRISVYPETQKIYGQGVTTFDPYSAYSWGLKISEWGTYTNQLGEEEEAKAYDNIRDFFRTGGTFNSNLNIANNFDRGNYSVGIGYSGQEGIVPNTDFQRVSTKFAGDYMISDKIKVGTLVNYSIYSTNGTTQSGGNSSIFYAAFNTPPSYNLKGNPTHVEGNEYQQINFRGSHDNIYWAVDHNREESQVSSLIGSMNIDYNPLNWLNLNYRVGIEERNNEGTSVYELGSGATGGRTDPPSGGRVSLSSNKRRSINSTFLASIKKNITDKLDFDFFVGHEFRNYDYKALSSNGTDFTIGGFHDLSNTNTVSSNQYWGRQRSYAFFSNLNLAYNNMLFLSLTGRNDVVSNMPRNNRSFFYPSVGLGFIFTEAIKVNPDILSFGKIRMSYAEVGQAGAIYSTVTTYSEGGANSFSFPFNGINAFTLSNSLKSTDLQPENTKSWEIGSNLAFLQNRVNIDYTYYYSLSEGQIFSVPISSSTGYTSETRNAGEMLNKGHEIMLGIIPVKSEKFYWDIGINYSAYSNIVEKLAEGVNMLVLGGNRVSIVAVEGEEYPILRGTGYARDPETGKIVVDSRETLANGSENASYGMPLATTGDIILGKANPDFEVSFMNTLKYKNISLYSQIDWRQGGKISSGDSRLAKLYGTHYDTKFREDDYVEDAVKGYYDNDGNLIIEGNNDITIQRGYQYFRRVLDPIRESNVYDASFIRLREVKLSYDLPVDFLKKVHIDRASIYAIGRNLWLIKSGLPHYDPEMSDGTGNAVGETYADYPQISSYGFGINLTF